MVLQAQGKLDEALACYRRALELRPDYAEAHNNLGNALRNQGKLDEAVGLLPPGGGTEAGLCRGPQQPGRCLAGSRGKLDEAVACCRRALELKPDYAEAHNNLGNAWRTRGTWTRRSPVTGGHWNCGRTMPRPTATWASPSRSKGRLDEAIACYRRALELQAGPCRAAQQPALRPAFLTPATMPRHSTKSTAAGTSATPRPWRNSSRHIATTVLPTAACGSAMSRRTFATT